MDEGGSPRARRVVGARFSLRPVFISLATVATAVCPSNIRGAEIPYPPGILKAEFIYEQAPFPSCHASTIAGTRAGLVAAWFGGTHEKHPDVGIWLSRHDGDKWSAPVEVANGIQSDGKRHPCWNPALFQP